MSTHVFDVTKALFIHAAKTGKHVAFQATYMCGCPGDPGENTNLEVDEIPLNKEKVEDTKQYVAAKFSLYPLGGGDYMDLFSTNRSNERLYCFSACSNAPRR